MSPTYAFIDRANGKFNTAMGFKKDYAAIISAAWDYDNAYDSYLRNPDENSYNELVALGLDFADTKANPTRQDILNQIIQLGPDHKFHQRFVSGWEIV